MIPIAPGFFKPVQASAPTSWEYSGAILSLCCYQLGGTSLDSGFNKDGSGNTEQELWYGSTDLDGLVYAFTTLNPQDHNYTSATYDRVVPFTFNENTLIIAQAYENDIANDVASHVWQLLDESDGNVFKFETVGRTSDYGVDCYITIGSGSRTQVAATGSYPALNHRFSFSGTTITGTDYYGGANHINTFTANSVDLSSATQLKVSCGRAYMSHGGNTIFNVYSRVGYFPDGI